MCEHATTRPYMLEGTTLGHPGDRECVDCGAWSFVPLGDVIPFPELADPSLMERVWHGPEAP